MVSLTHSQSLKSKLRIWYKKGWSVTNYAKNWEGGVFTPEFTMDMHFEKVAILGVLKQGTQWNGNKVACKWKFIDPNILVIG